MSLFNLEAINKKPFFYGFIYLVIIWVVIFAFVWLFTRPSVFPGLVLTNTGQIGDTIGGISNPIIGGISAIATFLAFLMQYLANRVHTRQFSEQATSQEADNHRNKLLYLIKQNRSIVENMTLQKHKGVRCLKKMFDEYRITHSIIENIINSLNGAEQSKKIDLSDEEKINIAYMFFYNGVGATSDKLNKEILEKCHSFEYFDATFKSIQECLKLRDPSMSKDMATLAMLGVKKFVYELKELGYKPLEGHNNRLGQYFRNFFHILDYTDSVDEKYLSTDEKYQIIKSLRSQLSNYEQMLIHINSLSVYGKPVRDHNFITDYKLIKNIPLPLIAFAGDIKQFYKDDNDNDSFKFEWDEIRERVN